MQEVDADLDAEQTRDHAHQRLDERHPVRPQQRIPALMVFTDIAGLDKGAATGEGLGNKFLSHIRYGSCALE